MREFYGHFAAAYGTFWFLLLLVAVLTGSNIQTGSIGMFGFPVVAVIYALSRTGESNELARLRQTVNTLEAAMIAAQRSAPPRR